MVMVADSDLQSECQRWLQVANYCNATSIALHSLTQPIPEVLQKFRWAKITDALKPGTLSAVCLSM